MAKTKKINWNEADFEIFFKNKPFLPDERELLFIHSHRAIRAEIDLIFMDINGDLVLIEVKNEKTTRTAIGQSLEYLSNYQNITLSDLESEYPDSDIRERFKELYGKELEAVGPKRYIVLVAPSFDYASAICASYLSKQFSNNSVEYILLKAVKTGEKFTVSKQEPPKFIPSREIQGFARWGNKYYYKIPNTNDLYWQIGKKNRIGLGQLSKNVFVTFRQLIPMEANIPEIDTDLHGEVYAKKIKQHHRAKILGQVKTGSINDVIVAEFRKDEFIKIEKFKINNFLREWSKTIVPLPAWGEIYKMMNLHRRIEKIVDKVNALVKAAGIKIIKQFHWKFLQNHSVFAVSEFNIPNGVTIKLHGELYPSGWKFVIFPWETHGIAFNIAEYCRALNLEGEIGEHGRFVINKQMPSTEKGKSVADYLVSIIRKCLITE